MKNFVSNSQIITIIAPIDMRGGVPIALGGFIAIPQYDALKDELVAVVTEGVVLLTITGTANIGDNLYFNNSDNTISTNQSSGICFGFAIESGANNEIKIMLNKSLDFNKTLIAACNDEAVKTAMKAAIQS